MRYLVALLFVISSFHLNAQSYVALWPEGKMPNSRGLPLTHEEADQRITRVEQPGMVAFLTPNESNTGAAVLICPSGGYHHLTYDLGGFQIAKWFNTLGINAFVLIYRLPTEVDLIEREKGPIQDAQRAMKIIRANAKKWAIDPDRIGVFGSSAGGHLASTLGTHDEDFSNIGDSLDALDINPAFMILVSPVITMSGPVHQGSVYNFLSEQPDQTLVDKYSNHLHVSDSTPPTFLVHAQNDPAVPCENSLLFYRALLEKKVSASLHIFTDGEHNIGINNNPQETDYWKILCKAWLKEHGYN